MCKHTLFVFTVRDAEHLINNKAGKPSTAALLPLRRRATNALRERSRCRTRACNGGGGIRISPCAPGQAQSRQRDSRLGCSNKNSQGPCQPRPPCMRVKWHDASDSSARCAKCTMAGTRPQRLYGSSAEAVTKVAALAPQDEPPGKWASQFRTDGPQGGTIGLSSPPGRWPWPAKGPGRFLPGDRRLAPRRGTAQSS